MPIEDVGYMLEHSAQDADMFFIESAARDTNYFKTPSEYTVTFSTPFTNVYGIEILDASIPTTMYSVDYFNNKFVYGYVTHKDTSMYQFKDIANELNYNKFYQDLTSTTNTTNMDMKHLFIVSGTKFDSYDESKVSSTPTNVLILKRLDYEIPDIRLFTDTIRNLDTHYFDWDGKTYSTNDSVAKQILQSQNGFYFNNNTLVVFEGKYLAESEARTTVLTSEQYAAGPLMSKSPTDSDCIWEIAVLIRYIEIEVGNYDITTLMNYLNKRFTDEEQMYAKIVLQNSWIKAGAPSASATDIAKQSIYKFSSDKNEFFFDLFNSTCMPSIGFGAKCDMFENPRYHSFLINNKLCLAYSRTESNNQETMYSPGLVNLQGI